MTRRAVRGRFLLILATVAASIVFFLPSTPWFPGLPGWWRAYLPHKGITLGLDLQGGIHLVLQVQGQKAVENLVERSLESFRTGLAQKQITVTEIRREGAERIVVSYPAESREKVVKTADDILPHLAVAEDQPGRLVLLLRPGESERLRADATSRALETIRNRVDQFGVAEPLIQQQGTDQILIQLPGIKDPQRAIALIGKTALLEFKLLDQESPIGPQLPEQVPADREEEVRAQFADKIPPGDEILFERIVDRETNRVTKRPYLVRKNTVVTGDLLTDARVAFGDFNEPYVSITFNNVGAALFERITSENVHKRLAIVLDNNVYSAPEIQERIAGGRAQISGQFTTQEANDLAIVLRAGALPAPVAIIQNVTVGPSLGQDSIEKGMHAGILGTILVVGFMAVYYRLSGVIADFAMVLNVILLIGALAAFNATLTLPGIAGIILTIGMSVDSNVLIFERIREELRQGKPVRLAVDAGYEKAFLTIVDSHVTTLITAFVLFLFGTGPIKGFAVTLSLGVTINLFTALVGTKVIFDLINTRRKLERLSI